MKSLKEKFNEILYPVDAECLSCANVRYEQLDRLSEIFKEDYEQITSNDGKINILKEEYPTIPVRVLEIMAHNNYNVDDTMLEFLKSLDSSILANILYRNFKDILYNITYGEDYIKFGYSSRSILKSDGSFRYLVSLFNYRIHTVRNSYIIIEKSFPKAISGRSFYKFFHVTDSETAKYIIDSGLRPKLFSNKIKNTTLLLKDNEKRSILPKSYLIALDKRSYSNTKIHNILGDVVRKLGKTYYSIIEIDMCPITLYKDPMMDDDYSYYTYDFIPAIYCNEFKLN